LIRVVGSGATIKRQKESASRVHNEQESMDGIPIALSSESHDRAVTCWIYGEATLL